MTQTEKQCYESISPVVNLFWVPSTWFASTLNEAVRDGILADPAGNKLIMEVTQTIEITRKHQYKHNNETCTTIGWYKRVMVLGISWVSRQLRSPLELQLGFHSHGLYPSPLTLQISFFWKTIMSILFRSVHWQLIPISSHVLWHGSIPDLVLQSELLIYIFLSERS